MSSLGAAEGAKNCSDVLGSPDPYSSAYVKLIKQGYASGLVSEDQIKELIHSKDPANPIKDAISSMSYPLKEGLDLILAEQNKFNLSWIKSELRLFLEVSKISELRETETRDDTKKIFAPKVVGSLDFNHIGELNGSSSADYFMRSNNRGLLAVGRNRFTRQVHVVYPGSPEAPIEALKGVEINYPPIYAPTLDGTEYVVVWEGSNLYLINLSSPRNPIRMALEGPAESPPKYFVAKDGRELLAVTAWSTIHFINLRDLSKSYSVPIPGGSWSTSPPHYYISRENNEFIVFDGLVFNFSTSIWHSEIPRHSLANWHPVGVLTKNGRIPMVELKHSAFHDIYFINPEDAQDKVSLKRLMIERQIPRAFYFTSSEGREFLGFNSWEEDNHLILVEPSKADSQLKFPVGGWGYSAAALFKLKDGKEMIAVHSTDRHLYIVEPQAPQSVFKVPVGDGIQSFSPYYYRTEQGDERILVQVGKAYFYILSLYNVPNSKNL